ncbi:MAG: transcription antitermination factor NusB [Pseudomonadota bacterium]
MTSSAQAHRRRERRSAARLSAVQALYQMDIAGTDLNQVIHEFTKLRTARPGEAAEDPGLADLAPLDETQGEILAIGHADHTFFAELLRGVMRLQTTIDPDVDQQLARGWRLARVDSILRQTLRAALYELIERTDVPARAAPLHRRRPSRSRYIH